VIEGDAALMLPLLAPVRVVTANILSSVLRDLLPVMKDSLAPEGVAILSGILVEERQALLAQAMAEGWRVIGEDTEANWWSVALGRGA
jgi:ribosomal protein L11 methyltransferase